MNFKETIQTFAGHPLTRQIIFGLLKDYQRPYDKISELIKEDVLLPIKRGVYVPGAKLKMDRPSPFLLANHLWGPSYVSFDSALSYWGLIPERVFEITSATTIAAKIFETKIGRFSYTHLTMPYYAFGIRQVTLNPNQTALMASPEKALCDKIIATSGLLFRSTKQVKDVLIEDFRMDEELVKQMNVAEMEKWIPFAPKKNSLSMIVKTIHAL